ncbi:MAG: hypothetical protein ACYDCK_09265 [Thermoplasmatota archaeon]
MFEPGKKTKTCAGCSRSLDLTTLQLTDAGEDLEEARRLAGIMNAKLAGRSEDFAAAMQPTPPAAVRHDGALDAAAAAARRGKGANGRADAVARRLGEFDAGDFEAACAGAGIAGPDTHIARLVAEARLAEPRAGRYRWIGP